MSCSGRAPPPSGACPSPLAGSRVRPGWCRYTRRDAPAASAPPWSSRRARRRCPQGCAGCRCPYASSRPVRGPAAGGRHPALPSRGWHHTRNWCLHNNKVYRRARNGRSPREQSRMSQSASADRLPRAILSGKGIVVFSLFYGFDCKYNQFPALEALDKAFNA